MKAYLPDGDTHFDKVFKENQEYYQIGTLIKALSCVQKFKVAVDVGAHVGLMTRVLQNVFLETHAFEPSVLAHTCLKENTDADKVTYYEAGLAAINGFARLSLKTENSGSNRFITELNERYQEIQVFNLDTVFEQYSEINFIKIDAQGQELNILKGGIDILYKCQPVILIEDKQDPGISNYLKEILDYKRIYKIRKDSIWIPL